MNRISKAFDGKKAFIPFITGGDPDIATTEKLLHTLDEVGADIIVLGVPFSDPIGESAVVEAATERALKAGFTVDALFDLLAKMRGEINAAVLLMTYYNPVYAYGVEKFTSCAKVCGVDGLIVPDLPFEERDELLQPCADSGLELISLIAPSSAQRIDNIAKNSGGFLYCVSPIGEGDATMAEMIHRAKAVRDIPCCAGFDIVGVEDVKEIAAVADGVIVGDAIVTLIAEHGVDCVDAVAAFAKEIRCVI